MDNKKWKKKIKRGTKNSNNNKNTNNPKRKIAFCSNHVCDCLCVCVWKNVAQKRNSHNIIRTSERQRKRARRSAVKCCTVGSKRNEQNNRANRCSVEDKKAESNLHANCSVTKSI